MAKDGTVHAVNTAEIELSGLSLEAFLFTYMMRPTPVRLRMLKSAAYDSQFLLVDRPQP